jgi:hypothetical protein
VVEDRVRGPAQSPEKTHERAMPPPPLREPRAVPWAWRSGPTGRVPMGVDSKRKSVSPLPRDRLRATEIAPSRGRGGGGGTTSCRDLGCASLAARRAKPGVRRFRRLPMRSEPALNPNNHAPEQFDCQTTSSSPGRDRVSADRACRARSVSPVAKPWVPVRAIGRGPVGAVHRGRAEDVFARWAKANHAGVVDGDGIGERPLQGRGVFGDGNPGLCPGLGEAALQAACRWMSIRKGKASPLSRETGCEQQRSLNRGGGAGVGEQRVVVISVAGRSP